MTKEEIETLVAAAVAAPVEKMVAMHNAFLESFQTLHQTQTSSQEKMTEALSKVSMGSVELRGRGTEDNWPVIFKAYDSLRRMKELDPEFPKYDGNVDNFLRWVVEVSDRKFVRQLPDEVAIVYARGALGENARGLLDPEQTFPDWSSFLEHLKCKLMTDSLQYKLVWESQHVKTRDWPRLVQIMSTYKMFVGKQFDGALMVSLIGNMPDHIRVKIIKKQPT